MTWFEVDKQGMAAMLERRSKSFVIFELVQNAWDSGASNVSIQLNPIEGLPLAAMEVEDDSPEGWADLSDAFTMFKRSRRGGDATKRGRFCLGEKLVLALCKDAEIITTTGGVAFNESGRRTLRQSRTVGTRFAATIRLTRDDLAEIEADAMKLIPPVPTAFNGIALKIPAILKRFDAKLPTEVQDDDGNLRRTVRMATVEAYPADGVGEILEMGIPVCEADFPWRLNVLQKVPLGMDRDAVTDAFRRALQVAAVNAMAGSIDPEQAAKPWASEAMGDSRIAPDAVRHLVTQRFGERAVVAVPGDPIANANAEATGCQVIHGGALSADAWANVRKHAILPTTSQAFPTPKPVAVPSQATCPLCKQPLK
jgi:hypothetical protein